jgi:hypothetical protein
MVLNPNGFDAGRAGVFRDMDGAIRLVAPESMLMSEKLFTGRALSMIIEF